MVLAKVSKSEFFFDVVPGDVLRYRVDIVELNESGSLVTATSMVGDRMQAQAELVFGHLETGDTVPKLMSRDELMTWYDNLHVFDVAIDIDGSRVPRDRVPPEVC